MFESPSYEDFLSKWRIFLDQGPSQNLAVDQGRDPQKVVQDPKVNRVLKAVPDLKAGLGKRLSGFFIQ